MATRKNYVRKPVLTKLEKFNQCYTIAENGCWIWKEIANDQRYGNFYFKGRLQSAHKASYILFIGEIEKGLVICHKCDDGHCCNPFHLFKGAQKENINDAQNKGRFKITEHPSRLTFKRGCRCDECCEVERAYQREWFHKYPEKAKAKRRRQYLASRAKKDLSL